MTELTIERVAPGPNQATAGVRLTATVPWSEMTRWTMDKMVERRVTLPADDDAEDEVFLIGDMPVDRDALLVVGAIPAVVAAVGRKRPHEMYGLLNGYALELEEQRDYLASQNHGDRSAEHWLTAEMTAIATLLRELRFATLTADGSFTRDELLKEERLLRGVEFARTHKRLSAS